MLPLISIALCTYNGAGYLEEQLLSIVNQTYSNIELIVVDDCSTDDTQAILDRFSATYPVTRVYRNDRNLGFNKNFQKAISLCKGEYIAIADQDDIWLPQKLEILRANIGDNWLAYSNSELIDSEGKQLGRQILNFQPASGKKSYKGLLLYNSVTGHTMLMKQEFRDYFMPIPAEGYYDWWIGFIAVYHQKAVYVNQCLTQHRIHQTSTTFTIYNTQRKEKRQILRNEVLTNLKLLQKYKRLSGQDRLDIEKISAAFSKGISPFLIKLIVTQYPVYFPDLKPRNFLSRLNFALKFLKK